MNDNKISVEDNVSVKHKFKNWTKDPIFIIAIIFSIIFLVVVAFATIKIEHPIYHKNMNEKFILYDENKIKFTTYVNSYCFTNENINPYYCDDVIENPLNNDFLWCCVSAYCDYDYLDENFICALNYHFYNKDYTYGNSDLTEFHIVTDIPGIVEYKANIIYCFKISKDVVLDMGYNINQKYNDSQNKGLSVTFALKDSTNCVHVML